MSTDNVTPISPAKPLLPSRKVIADRATSASNELYRVSRMVQMLRLVADGDVLGGDHAGAVDGIGETLDVIEEIVGRVANDLDSVVLLAPEQKE